MKTPWELTTCYNRPGAKTARCAACGKPFVMAKGGWEKTPVMVRERQVSWFRGEDIVQFAHPACITIRNPPDAEVH